MNAVSTAAYKGTELIIVGGGISGLGIAREAALKGFKPVLLERGECCRAASNSSLRIIHGGFRYLQTADLFRVIRSLRDQSYWLEHAAELVRAIPCVMALQRFGFKSRWPVSAALSCYCLLYRLFGCRKYAGGKVLSADWVREEIPLLSDLAAHGVLLWHDALLPNPEGFAEFLKDEAQEAGAAIIEHAVVSGIVKKQAGYEVTCEESQGQSVYQAPVVINAAGAWLPEVRKLVAGTEGLPEFRWCKAYNVILKRQIEKRYGIGLQAEKGRLYFLVPRDYHSVIGTCYIPYEGAPNDALVTLQELEAFLASFNRVFGGAALTVDDVSDVEVGVLPMRNVRSGEPVLYGSERLYRRGGYIEVLSTKYTTFGSQGQAVLKLVQAALRG